MIDHYQSRARKEAVGWHAQEVEWHAQARGGMPKRQRGHGGTNGEPRTSSPCGRPMPLPIPRRTEIACRVVTAHHMNPDGMPKQSACKARGQMQP